MGTAGVPSNLIVDPFHLMLHLLSQISALTSLLNPSDSTSQLVLPSTVKDCY
jgi:hypothetical protein